MLRWDYDYRLSEGDAAGEGAVFNCSVLTDQERA
jgi:hypothetical protein